MNKNKKIVIVGGVAGGATAIARLRRLDENAEIILLEKGEFVSFANCGLPYYIGGVIHHRDALFVSDIRSIENKYNVEIRNFSEVVEINRDEKKVLVKNTKDGKEYFETYDKLLLSTGSKPFVPNMNGTDNKNVFTLWTIPDTDKIFKYIQENNVKRAVVAGGGFIGIEMAENLIERGIAVTLVEFADQILTPLDKDMSTIVANHAKEKGINLILQTGVKEIINDGKQVLLSNDEIIDTDMILLSIGVRPNTEFVKEAGLSMGDRAGVIVDEYMQTSDPDIYAVGDMIEVTHGVSGLKTMIPLAGPANKQGRAVAANILGQKEEKYDGTIGTSIVKVFDLTVATTGENEKMLQARGLKLWEDYGYSLVHPMSHAGYYPGAMPLSVKLLFDKKDGRVLGAQIIGYDGVDKRIDTVATTIHFKGSIYDLTKLELAYAPPFSSAKDPINIAGYAATNIFEGLSTPISLKEYNENKEDYVLIDVREDMETITGGMEAVINVPLTRLREEYVKLDKDKKYVVYCAVGLRGYLAERILKQKGYTVFNLLGGYRTYQQISNNLGSESGNKSIEQEKLIFADSEEAGMTDGNLESKYENIIELNVCGLSCPGPIMKVAQKMNELNEGDTLFIKSSDPGFLIDIESWCKNTSNTFISKESSKECYMATIRKGCEDCDNHTASTVCGSIACSDSQKVDEKTMIVFDGDLDKALAAFIIANGSLAMGNKVNMFFTFWGLNVLRKKKPEPVKKDFISGMFGRMMPKGASKLGLSKMHFAGAGSAMMRSVMKKKGIASLEELIEEAINSGVRLVACQMSMDVMGITKEELIDGVEVGGVATMLHYSDRSNMNLFI
ncbi:MAG: FAD-dependent oxidoreductase [Gallibacter sp.]|nr:FAD-dependent oxidoreductase [Gallibacter sp.]